MSEIAARRVRMLYESDHGRRWLRVAQQRPATYFEENIAVGRRELQDRLVDWLAERDGPRILDAGCGFGDLSVRLASNGADVTGIDLVPEFIETARRRGDEGGARFDVGDFLDELPGERERNEEEARYDVVVLCEVLEDYEAPERFAMLRHIAASGVPLLYLAFRTVGDEGGGLWQRLTGTEARGIGEIELLRWIHLATPYRQTRQAKVRVRNYRAHLSELQRER